MNTLILLVCIIGLTQAGTVAKPGVRGTCTGDKNPTWCAAESADCGEGYTMTGMTDTFDEYCCETCGSTTTGTTPTQSPSTGCVDQSPTWCETNKGDCGKGQTMVGIDSTFDAYCCKTCSEQPPPASTGTFSAETILAKHNELRAKHGVVAMTWSTTLADQATTWAKGLVDKGKMVHSTFPEGENLYWSAGSGGDWGVSATTSWYDEIKDYQPSAPESNTQKTGHFTQVIWKGSTVLGCGYAETTKYNEVYISCNYSPAGNVKGNYDDNVICNKLC